MKITGTAVKAILELSEILNNVSEQQSESLVQEIINSKKVFIAGAGRSLLALKCFAMRLMHLGFEVFVVGDTTTPAFEPGDLLIVGSGSGETLGSVNIAKKAKSLGGRVALITTRENSTLANISDLIIVIPAFTDKVNTHQQIIPTLPGGTMFEEAMLILCDTIILPLAKLKGVPTDRPFSRHANLE